MEKNRAMDLARSIARQIKTGTTIGICELDEPKWQELNLPHLGNKEVLAVFEISEDENKSLVSRRTRSLVL